MKPESCDPRYLICPRCRKPLHGITAGDGSFVTRCDSRTLVKNAAGGLIAQPCRQPVHVLGTREGVAFVLPITDEMYDRLQRHQPAGSVYREVGAIGGKRE